MKIKKYWQFITEAEGDEDEGFDEEGFEEETGDSTDEFDDSMEEEEKDYVSNENPETIIKNKLTIIKNKIEKMFPTDVEPSGEVTANSDDIDKKVSSEGMTFQDLGMRIESAELSTQTKTHQNLEIKFSDEDQTYYYTLLVRIDLKQATGDNVEEGEEVTSDTIKRCFIKFKKYQVEGFELMGELTKNIDIDELDEDFLINLKIELDEEFGGGGEEEFSIEYE
ncbi:MAG: hypothetical protein SLAVMIC_00796 [uncultured marine phage]|uniref:Uncharacterized protein n=1 Tax=uncultured marine phage TaxID=707152 RepID=A0A8D9CCQ6_9VIRU|nr:MAG: hypothetical protein SLAVMIC_00796 [uncultured marine phage]